MGTASGVRALKQRTERAAVAGHIGLAAQRSGLGAAFPAITKTSVWRWLVQSRWETKTFH